MMKSSDDGGHFGAIFGQFFMDFRRKTLGNWGGGGFNDSSIGVFSKMPRFPKIFARRRRRHKNGRCDSLLENRRFPRVSWFFMGLG